MFKKQEIEKAVRIHKLGYRFLMYITDKIDKRKFTFSRVHKNESSSDVIFNWVSDYYDYLPNSILPEKNELKEFSNYFASYLTVSFELNETPERISNSSGCYCDVCLQFQNLSHLKSISPRNMDREIAKQKRIEIIKELAQSKKINLSHAQSKSIADDENYLRDAAYLAYTKALMKRMHDSEGGIFILALWREIAWNDRGSPIADFEFRVKDIIKACQSLELRIQKSSNT